MKRDEKQRYRLVPETAHEQVIMTGYEQGFNDGYLQAQYDNMTEEQKNQFEKIEGGLISLFDMFGKKDGE